MKPLIVASVLMLAACAGGGAGAPPPERAPTIVSLNPCTDAILAEVAAPGQLLAISHYSKDPRASSMEAAVAARFAATGGTVEEVLALDPDVVVAGSFLAPATRAALAELGMEVVTFDIAADVAASKQQIRDLCTGILVEITRRLIGDQNLRVRCKRAGECHTLLFPTGHLCGVMIKPFAKTNGDHLRAGFFESQAFARQFQRDSNILQRGHVGNQMKRLENNANIAAPKRGKTIFANIGCTAKSNIAERKIERVKVATSAKPKREFAACDGLKLSDIDYSPPAKTAGRGFSIMGFAQCQFISAR